MVTFDFSLQEKLGLGQQEKNWQQLISNKILNTFAVVSELRNFPSCLLNKSRAKKDENESKKRNELN